MLNSQGGSSTVLSALAAKRAELGAKRAQLCKQVALLDQELACLDGAMKLFSESPPPIKAQTALSQPRSLSEFKRGEIGKAALVVLRAAGHPLSTQEVGAAICSRFSMPFDERDHNILCLRVMSCFRTAQQRGLVREVGRTSRNAVLWFAASDSFK